MAKRKYDDDDGRVIAPMNVEGMPWYTKRGPESDSAGGKQKEPVKLSFGETLAVIGGVMKAVVLVGGIFLAAFAIVILFLQFVLFR